MKLYYDAQKVEIINGNIIVTPYIFRVNHDKIRYIIQNDTVFVLANDVARVSGYKNASASTMMMTRSDKTRLKLRTRHNMYISMAVYVNNSSALMLVADPKALVANSSGYVYILEAERANGKKIIKIGSTKNHKNRYKALMRYCCQADLKPRRFYVTKKHARYTATEFTMHNKFKKYRYPRSEWFDADFDSAKAELNRIMKNSRDESHSVKQLDIDKLFDEIWLDYRSKSEPNRHIVLDTADTASARLLEALSEKHDKNGFIVLDFVDEEATKNAMKNRKD